MAARLEGQDALIRRLKAIGEPKPLLRAIQLEAKREAKLLAPRKTGNLAKTIDLGDLTDHYAIVEARARYAAFVERGTRPHIIRPKKKAWLAFPAPGSATLAGRTKVGGRRIFAKVVHHPGTKPKPYLLPGARKALARGGFRDRIVKNWNEAA